MWVRRANAADNLNGEGLPRVRVNRRHTLQLPAVRTRIEHAVL